MSEKIKPPEKLSIAEHAAALKVEAATLAGVAALANWKRGRKVSLAEFKKALNHFQKSPADSRKGGKK